MHVYGQVSFVLELARVSWISSNAASNSFRALGAHLRLRLLVATDCASAFALAPRLRSCATDCAPLFFESLGGMKHSIFEAVFRGIREEYCAATAVPTRLAPLQRGAGIA